MSLVMLLLACLQPPPALPTDVVYVAPPAPITRVKAPVVAFSPPTREGRSPAASPLTADEEAARKILLWVVDTYTGDPQDPWAIGHGMLALGKDMDLADGKKAVPWLFEEYAEWLAVDDDRLVRFPRSRPGIRIEPHSDLMLKALMESGVDLETTFMVQGKPAKVADLYRHSLYRAWVDSLGNTGFDSMGDTPWALQALATVAPRGLSWTAEGNHPMSMDAFTDAVATDLAAQTAFMKEAMAKGEVVKKERQGIFAYTCGGQHHIQGLAYAVGRGFGTKIARDEIQAQIPILFWRLDVELQIYDTYLAQSPEYGVLLLEQRLKFLGHFLESTHKMAALGLYTPDEAQLAALARARKELVNTLSLLDAEGILKGLPSMRADPKSMQVYLDYVGDSAHALRGLDLASGAGTIRY